MADNFATNPGSGGATFASDDISGVQFPRIKLIHGADNANDGDVSGTNPLPVVSRGMAAGGCSIFRSLDLDESEEEVKSTGGTVYGYFIANLASAARFVKFYNATAANVTVGTTAPVLTIPLGAGEKANVSCPQGIGFATAICVAATTALADADTGAPGANEVVVNILYV